MSALPPSKRQKLLDLDALVHFDTWMVNLRVALRAVLLKQEADIRQDNRKLIAQVLANNHCTITTPVEQILAIIAKRQRMGDSHDFATVMDTIPDEWLRYRIVVQENASAYFHEHQSEDPNFMEKYFATITFGTLWNGVWQTYIRVPEGGRHFEMLNQIKRCLQEMDTSNTKDAFIEKHARLPIKANAFEFSESDMDTISNIVHQASEVQDQQQQEAVVHMSKMLIHLDETMIDVRQALLLSVEIVQPFDDKKELEDFAEISKQHILSLVESWRNKMCTKNVEIGFSKEVMKTQITQIQAQIDTSKLELRAILDSDEENGWPTIWREVVFTKKMVEKAEMLRAIMQPILKLKHLPIELTTLVLDEPSEDYITDLKHKQEAAYVAWKSDLNRLLLTKTALLDTRHSMVNILTTLLGESDWRTKQANLEQMVLADNITLNYTDTVNAKIHSTAISPTPVGRTVPENDPVLHAVHERLVVFNQKSWEWKESFNNLVDEKKKAVIQQRGIRKNNSSQQAGSPVFRKNVPTMWAQSLCNKIIEIRDQLAPGMMGTSDLLDADDRQLIINLENIAQNATFAKVMNAILVLQWFRHRLSLRDLTHVPSVSGDQDYVAW